MRLIVISVIIAIVGFVFLGYRARHRLFGFNSSISEWSGSAPISIELSDAPAAPSSERRVLLWLQYHRRTIDSASQRFGVDCAAVGGIIAFEALQDPMWTTLGDFARWVGPGKVHYKEFYGAEGNPVARQVEEEGYVKHHSMAERRKVLSTASGSAMYIAAILRAFSDRLDLSDQQRVRDSALLTSLYSETSLDSLGSPKHGFVASKVVNSMGVWIVRNHFVLLRSLRRCHTT